MDGEGKGKRGGRGEGGKGRNGSGPDRVREEIDAPAAYAISFIRCIVA